MGLDMYLSAKRYLWSIDEKDVALSNQLDKEVGGQGLGRTKEISRDAYYWRKAWAIHSWFVDNVQNGDDNCREYYVSRQQLEELLNILKMVDENPLLADELLPLQSDSEDGKEWELGQIKKTIPDLERLLNEDLEQWDFYYSSSW